ncbi:MAG: pyrroline-5-carboxylate reductase [Promethearchaeota archaeon]|jgi:pyrroline-5-carboxylate reductase
MPFQKELGIIGLGKIGSTILRVLVNSKTIGPEKIIIHDIQKDILLDRSKELKVDFAENNQAVLLKSKYIIIAVLPQVIDEVLDEISPVISEDHVIITIAAGISIDHVKKHFDKNVGIVRVMTNTPALVRAAASAISSNKVLKQTELEYVKNLFSTLGLVVELEEKHLDAVTGLSGSGPAYLFIIIESMADGGVKMGLPRDIAVKLAAQTVLGAGKLVLETKKHPGELKDMVASPGGTTITAIHEIESAKLRATLIRAVEAATLKSKSMNKKV